MEKVLYGLGVVALGMVVVFAGLIILIGFIALLGKLTKEKEGGVEKKKLDEPVKAEAAPVPCQEEVSDELSPEVLAAITAAIACVWNSENGFVVRRVKRIQNAPAWSRAGREEQSFSHI